MILRVVFQIVGVLRPENCSLGQQGGGSNQSPPLGPGTDRL